MYNRFKKNIFKIILSLAGVTLSYTGSALCAFANIGQGPVGAFQYAVSLQTGIQMGTIAFIFQAVFVFAQFLIERHNFKIYQLLQLLVSAYGGIVLNIVLYGILGGVRGEIPYFIKVLILVVGFLLYVIGVVFTLELNLVRVPLESFLKLLASRTPITLGRYKQLSDFILLILAAGICIWGKQSSTIREGTLLNALMFGVMIDLFQGPVRRLYQKWHILE
ncbi:MAG: hypothetical protein PUG54_03285 [Firmicutes bacterium]|nr:hypothetical protein [Bacillota bacterium]